MPLSLVEKSLDRHRMGEYAPFFDDEKFASDPAKLRDFEDPQKLRQQGVLSDDVPSVMTALRDAAKEAENEKSSSYVCVLRMI